MCGPLTSPLKCHRNIRFDLCALSRFTSSLIINAVRALCSLKNRQLSRQQLGNTPLRSGLC